MKCVGKVLVAGRGRHSRCGQTRERQRQTNVLGHGDTRDFPIRESTQRAVLKAALH